MSENTSMKNRLVAISLLAVTPSMAYGNVVWPALYAEAKITSLPIITLSLFLEFFVVKTLFNKGVNVSVLITVVMNLVSGLIGLFLRPLSGLAWELSLGQVVMWSFSWGTFNPIAWFFVPVIGGAINAIIELLTVRAIWKERLSRKRFLWFWLINWMTVGLATLWVISSPPMM